MTTVFAVAVAVGLVLAAASTAAAAPPGKSNPPGKPPHGQAGSARGIVQSATTNAVIVKELDGTSVEIPVALSTHVFLDGRRATLDSVRPGLVALASWKADKASARLLLFGASATIAVVRSVGPRSVVVTMPSGSRATIRVTPKTHVLIDGKPAELHAVKRGSLLVLRGTAPASRPATELRFLRPG